MKRLTVFIAAALAACVLFTACKSGYGKAAQIALEEALKTETDLEFFILDDVSSADLSDFQEIYGGFGARQYAPKRYGIASEGSIPQEIPEHRVLFTVSAWPDYADGGKFVTDINITDPKVRVFGLTTESTAEEFLRKCTSLGYERVERRDDSGEPPALCGTLLLNYACVRSRDGKHYILLAKYVNSSFIRIYAPVSNRSNIIF